MQRMADKNTNLLLQVKEDVDIYFNTKCSGYNVWSSIY